jgi:hypothetical protein
VKHRRRRGRHAAPRRRTLPRNNQTTALALTACALAASASGLLLQGFDQPPPPRLDSAPLTAADLDRADDPRVSRDRDRAPLDATPSAVPSPVPVPPAPPVPVRPAPVAGLDQAQMDNAVIIVRVGQQRHLPQRAMVIAVATALQESDLYNQASRAVPESFRYPHQGDSVDADSVGLFQQRPSQGWGTVAQLMDPAHSAGLFYDGLVRVSGWQSMDLASAAQAVQRSAYPGAYRRHETRAAQIVAAAG